MLEFRSLNRDNICLSIFSVIFAVFALSLGDAIIKKYSSTLVLWQIFVLRSLITIPILIILIRALSKNTSLFPLYPGWTGIRSIMLTFQWIAYYIALPHVDISVAASSFYTLPIFITLFSSIFNKEKFRKYSYLSVFLGFLGVLMILRPRIEAFNVYGLLPLISAILYAGAMILTRTKCRGENPLILSLNINLIMLLTGLIAAIFINCWQPSFHVITNYKFLLGVWGVMGKLEWSIICVLAITMLIGNIGAAVAYQIAPSSIVAPYDFFYIGFAILWGVIMFNEVPDSITAIGILMIVVAGLISMKR